MIANPTFSASKLKAMAPTATECVDLLVALLKEKARVGKPFDIYAMYQALTLDVIGRCAFGIHTDCQNNPNDEFLICCKQVFVNAIRLDWIKACGILLPEFPNFWMGVAEVKDRVLRDNPFVTLEERLKDLVARRKSVTAGSKSIDLLQLLLDSEAGENEFDIENEQVRSWRSSEGEDQPKTYKRLLGEEVVSTCLLFLLAGYETTSTALAYATYFLATNPEVQKKVQDEIDSDFNEDNPYETIFKCEYIDWVISETLRLYPIATPIQGRKCMETCVVGDGEDAMAIPAGMTVMADVWTVHYDQQIWGPDADKFRPERFSPEESEGRHPMAFLPFGAGPRNCIGMRFALMEAKLTLLKMLKRFTLEPCSETEIPPKIQEGATTTPTNGITVIIKERIR
jgi:cytochrome P450